MNKEKQIDKRMPCWASDVNLIRKVQVIQEKLIDGGILDDNLAFDTEKGKREFLKPKIDKLCALMDQEYEINVRKIKKKREEEKRAQMAKYTKEQQIKNLQSRSAQLAAGYTFKNQLMN